MADDSSAHSIKHSKLFRNSLLSTVVAIIACLSTHLLTLAGITVAVAWFDAIEHALVLAVIGGACLTVYATYRHRRGCRVGRAS